jgi:hypothetical protein
MVQNLIIKSIGDNLKIATFLFYGIFPKKSFFFAFFTNLLKNKKVATFKLSPIDLKLNFVR